MYVGSVIKGVASGIRRVASGRSIFVGLETKLNRLLDEKKKRTSLRPLFHDCETAKNHNIVQAALTCKTSLEHVIS